MDLTPEEAGFLRVKKVGGEVMMPEIAVLHAVFDIVDYVREALLRSFYEAGGLVIESFSSDSVVQKFEHPRTLFQRLLFRKPKVTEFRTVVFRIDGLGFDPKLAKPPLRTKTGRILTDADFAALANEAERGYDVKRLLRRRDDWRKNP